MCEGQAGHGEGCPDLEEGEREGGMGGLGGREMIKRLGRVGLRGAGRGAGGDARCRRGRAGGLGRLGRGRGRGCSRWSPGVVVPPCRGSPGRRDLNPFEKDCEERVLSGHRAAAS